MRMKNTTPEQEKQRRKDQAFRLKLLALDEATGWYRKEKAAQERKSKERDS